MRKKMTKYALYTLSFLVGVVLLIGAGHSFFVESEIGVVSFAFTAAAGILCMPFVFLVIANKSKMTGEQVLKVAVGLWLIGVLLPLIGL